MAMNYSEAASNMGWWSNRKKKKAAKKKAEEDAREADVVNRLKQAGLTDADIARLRGPKKGK